MGILGLFYIETVSSTSLQPRLATQLASQVQDDMAPIWDNLVLVNDRMMAPNLGQSSSSVNDRMMAPNLGNRSQSECQYHIHSFTTSQLCCTTTMGYHDQLLPGLNTKNAAVLSNQGGTHLSDNHITPLGIINPSTVHWVNCMVEAGCFSQPLTLISLSASHSCWQYSQLALPVCTAQCPCLRFSCSCTAGWACRCHGCELKALPSIPPTLNWLSRDTMQPSLLGGSWYRLSGSYCFTCWLKQFVG